MNVNLFYLSDNRYGGWVTFTYHLVQALKSVGVTSQIVKIGNRTEEKQRDFGYDLSYRNVSMLDATSESGSVHMIVALQKNFREQANSLLRAGAYIVCHDITELPRVDVMIEQKRMIVIRKVGLVSLPNANFIRHPYTPFSKVPPDKDLYRTWRAISTSRIDFDKHTDIILEANRHVREDKKCKIMGFENRLYTKFKIAPKFPEWEQSKWAYPRTPAAAYEMLKHYELSVDMSIIKNDGGGTQYTTLEAWDAGAVPVIHSEWIRDDDDMVPNRNCLIVKDSMGLASTLSETNLNLIDRIRHNGWHRLTTWHTPTVIGTLYKEVLFGKA